MFKWLKKLFRGETLEEWNERLDREREKNFQELINDICKDEEHAYNVLYQKEPNGELKECVMTNRQLAKKLLNPNMYLISVTPAAKLAGVIEEME